MSELLELEERAENQQEFILGGLGSFSSSPTEDDENPAFPGIPLHPMRLRRVLVRQDFSDQASFDRFIAVMISEVPGVKLVSRERFGEKFRFYTLIDDADAETMNAIFQVELKIYARFPDDDLELEVLPGEELACVIPSGAVELWRSK